MARTDVPLRPLGELVDVLGGGTPSKDNEAFWVGSIPWVSPKDMKSPEIFDSIDHISEAALASSACKLIEPPAVLFVVRGMILTHTLPVAISRVPLAINQDMKALLPREGLDAEYLAYVLSGASRQLLAQVEIAGHGTRRMKTETWQGLLIPLPAPFEQRRIAARVREALDYVDEMRRLHEEALKETRALHSKILRKAFAGEL
jgi:type I restriction enzyme, S subunit